MSESGADFSTTGWTLIDQLQNATGEQRAALEQRLATCYWPPVYGFYRSCGEPEVDAADLAQGFFTDVVIGRGLFDRAESSRGRLRSLIRTAARRYRVDVHRSTGRANAKTRLMDPEALAREERFLGTAEAASPDDQFDRRWATLSLELALELCERRMGQLQLDRHWSVFEAFLVQPAITGRTAPDLGDLAEQFGFDSRVHAASALKVVRKHFRLALREVAAGNTTDPAEQDAEYRDLMDLLGG